MLPADLQQHVRDLVEPTVQRLGFDLVAVELTTGARRPLLRLTVDAPGGVGADDCARISRQVSPLLDAEDPLQGSWDLEVSSPGIERPVQRIEDFRRFQGYRARLRLVEGPPRRRYTGMLSGVEGDDVLVEVDGQIHRLPFPDIERAHLMLDLDEFQALAEGLPELPSAEEDRHDDQ